MIGRLANVIDYFRSDDDPRAIWDGDGGGQQLQVWQHPEQEQEIAAISSALAAQNTMLSVEETARRLTYDAIVPSVHRSFGERSSESTDVAEAIIATLLSFERFTVVELPVMYLSLKSSFAVDGVTFEPLDIAQFKESIAGKWTYQIYNGRLMAKGRVNSPGDDWKHLTNAVETVDGALRLLSGILFPWQVDQAVVPAIPGNGPQPGATPYRTPKPYGDVGWDGSFGTLHRPGGSMNPQRISEELWGDDATSIAAFLNLPRTTETEKRIYTAFRWLGEACRAHDRTGRFVAAMTALEALLAIRNDDMRSSAGATAVLAERTAFLSGTPDGRIATHHEVVRLYGIRSAVVHGRVPDVNTADIAKAGRLAWEVARALFQRRGELRSDYEVSRWILEQRYRVIGDADFVTTIESGA